LYAVLCGALVSVVAHALAYITGYPWECDSIFTSHWGAGLSKRETCHRISEYGGGIVVVVVVVVVVGSSQNLLVALCVGCRCLVAKEGAVRGGHDDRVLIQTPS
jgi:hypothetical protein